MINSHEVTKNKSMVVVGECAASCVEDASTTCFTPSTTGSNFLYEPPMDDDSNNIDSLVSDAHVMRQRKRSSNTLGIYCLVGDLSEGTHGAASVMCMSGQKCRVSVLYLNSIFTESLNKRVHVCILFETIE